jgi:GTP-binding protein
MSLLIRSAAFHLSAVQPRQFPDDGRPQIAFAGRSNVGKSSLINCLLNRRGLARASSTPGRTREINFFAINDAFWFVDLPGFGYAKVPLSMRDQWRKLIEAYVERTEALRTIVFLLDARHEPQPADHLMLDWLVEAQVPFIPVLTKIDKLPKTKRRAAAKGLEKKAPVLAACEPVLFSAKTREGRDALLERIEAYL